MQHAIRRDVFGMSDIFAPESIIRQQEVKTILHPTSTMGPGATLPFDILVSIIDSLASGDDADIQCLQILSQTCKFMAPLCRKHLFSSIHLQDHSKLDSRRFNELLSNNPDIAHYVRSLQYVFYNPIGDHELNILDMPRERSPLQSIAVRAPFDKWKDLPESIRSSVVFLMQLPTITELRLQSFQGFPPTALSRCGNLIDLHLTDSLILGPPDVNPAISRSKIPTPVSLFAFLESGSYDGLAALLNSASLDDGPIVDFSGLRNGVPR
ncbi:hypothetical protein M413DRAFT_30728 [Hebeloma cylindrosporum]|uniref:F-box domain-containing protein n=1 Tax=Hebeloma cylindrosporum TaxID=76867 RepID=A0A0C3C0K4_HEBCY|nr:hypothetical protein M413DRAFT_30728 [Hebeloma cylindrosporum h7]